MKSIVLSCVLCCSLLTLFAQEDIKTNGLYYKISVATTLTTNEEYTLFNDQDESFIVFNAVFINNSIGYQFDNRTSMDLNVEYDHHSRKSLNFLPVFLGFNYNILDFDDVLFVRGGYGKLINIGKNFENGTMYKVGIGLRIFDENFKNSGLIGLDFNRKRFGYKQKDKLSSVSIFLEFMVF
ncbi:hypothetical protein [Gelidibacter maritimus]|uniref:Outer membrane protein beta-barrel domain-containing protein n=1 Tax=Gelidibacter maritimus TaxID=2761487 RepID=A0A7W2R2A7_9FLAO|nr:hypothetical protein [Gelidibacter maritimus]MBA6151616.1 hypothetical protein [Gelidibacter maritimus]